MPRIRMCDADRERYGGPEWLEISLADLLDEETGLIEQVELQWDITPEEFERRVRRGSLIATRAMVWAALRKAGVHVSAQTFRPKVLNAWDPSEGGDPDPSRPRFEALPSGAGDVGPPVEAPVPNRTARRAAKKATAARGPARAAASRT